MPNTMDYLQWRGDLPFSAAPINSVDEYIFTCIGKPDLTGIVSASSEPVPLNEVLASYFSSHDSNSLGLVASAMTLPILKQLQSSTRYQNLKLSNFVKKISLKDTEQFSALTVLLPNDTRYVTFRGTDDSLVGWKENCELAGSEPVPAQLDAASYLERVADTTTGSLIVSGHSKGGNLAIYAAATASKSTRDRIRKVYSFDGPGFLQPFFNSEGFLSIQDKVTTFLPENSIVGMLLEHAGTLRIISSQTAGISGHDGFTWDTCRDGFVYTNQLSRFSKVFNAAIDESLFSLSDYEKNELIEDILELLSSTNCYTLSELKDNAVQNVFDVASTFRKSKELKQFIRMLVQNSVKEVREIRS